MTTPRYIDWQTFRAEVARILERRTGRRWLVSWCKGSVGRIHAPASRHPLLGTMSTSDSRALSEATGLPCSPRGIMFPASDQRVLGEILSRVRGETAGRYGWESLPASNRFDVYEVTR